MPPPSSNTPRSYLQHVDVDQQERDAAQALADAADKLASAADAQLRAAKPSGVNANYSGVGPAGQRATTPDQSDTEAYLKLQLKRLLVQIKDPQERLGLLRDHYREQPALSVNRLRAGLAIDKEEDRQERSGATSIGRQQADEKRNFALQQRQQKDQAKAEQDDVRRQQAWEARQLAASRRQQARDAAAAEREARRQEKEAAASQARQEKDQRRQFEGYQRLQAKQEKDEGASQLRQEQGQRRQFLRYQSDQDKLRKKREGDDARAAAKAKKDADDAARQAGRDARAKLAGGASTFSGLAGTGASLVSGVGSAITSVAAGDVSGVFKTALSGVQTFGNALSALGPEGTIAGTAINLMASAASTAVDALDGLVSSLGKYSAATQLETAKLQVATIAMQIKLAAATEPLMVEWQRVKTDFVGAIADLAPEIRAVAEAFRFLLQPARELIANYQNSSGDPGTRTAKAIGKTWLNLVTGQSALPASGGGGSGAGGNAGFSQAAADDLAARFNSMMLEAARRARPEGSPGPSIQYQAPGGDGLSFNHHSEHRYEIRDEAFVERLIENVRDGFEKFRTRATIGGHVTMGVGSMYAP